MKKNNKIFLPHLYESLRQRIAVLYIQQEMRKFFPQLRDKKTWELIDRQIKNWYKNLSIRNFWNGIHGISIGFRLKSIVPWITSLNMEWVEKNIAIENLWFGGRFGPIVRLNVIESSPAVKEFLFRSKNRKILTQIRKKLKEESVKTVMRDDFPILVIRKEGRLRVIDGNRRLLQTIIDGKNSIRAFIGEPIAEPTLYEYWLPTSFLVDLIFWHKKRIQSNKKITNSAAVVIAELIRNSSAGRIEFRERAVNRDEKNDLLLLKAVSRILPTLKK